MARASEANGSKPTLNVGPGNAGAISQREEELRGLFVLGVIAATSALPAYAQADMVKWKVRTSTSAIDDTKTVIVDLASDNMIHGRFKSPGPAALNLRCMENTTSASIKFNGLFMADIQGYGQVTYRVDSAKAVTKRFEESTNNEWLGLWNGGASIPFIKSLFGAEKLVVRATPFNENAVEVTFSIQGLEKTIEPLREACNW